jgi:translation initiation factor 1A
MPQKGKRKGARKAGAAEKSREVPYRDEDGQTYALVTAMLGNGRLTARCEDTVERMCKIRGSMRRSEWISVGDLILVSLREFQDSKGDVLHRYPHEDVRRLRKIGELRAIKFADQREEVHEEEIIVFEEEDDEDVTMLIDAL